MGAEWSLLHSSIETYLGTARLCASQVSTLQFIRDAPRAVAQHCAGDYRPFERSVQKAARKTIGMAVGLHTDHGAPQRLGLAWNIVSTGTASLSGQIRGAGRTLRVEDDKVLWLVKAI